MELSLQHLRLLREVARQSTITAAADTLGYTRSAVSQQLIGLERSTGVAVLERIGRNVRLTDAGRELVRHADDVLNRMEAAQSALESIGDEARGTLRVGIYESVAGPFLAPLVARLGVSHPMMRIRSREIEPEDALDAVAHGDLDFAFTLAHAHDPVPDRPDIVRTPIVEECFIAVVPATERAPASLELSSLAQRPFIAPSPTSGCGRAIVVACRDAGFEPDIAHQVDSYTTALDLVAAGCGIAVVPKSSVHQRDDVGTIRLTNPPSRTIDVSHRTSSTERPMIKAALNCLREIGRQTEYPLAEGTGETGMSARERPPQPTLIGPVLASAPRMGTTPGDSEPYR